MQRIQSSVLYMSQHAATLENIVVEEKKKKKANEDDDFEDRNIAQMLLEAEVGEIEPFASSCSVLFMRKLELLMLEMIPALPRKTVLSWLEQTMKQTKKGLRVIGTFCSSSSLEKDNDKHEFRNKIQKLFFRIVHLDDKDVDAERRMQILKSMKCSSEDSIWKNVIGYDDVKRALDRLIRWKWFHMDDLTRMGVVDSGCSGVLLYGPSGCGKTYLAQQLGKEVGVSFLSVKASDIYSKWYGESERAVRDVFAQARSNRPCILFLDEVDALAPSRQTSENEGDNAVGARVLSTLLNELDGVDTRNQGLVVIGATNRMHAVDEAALRPGRLGSRVHVDFPTDTDRDLLFHHFLAKTPLDEDVDFNTLVNHSLGYSVAQIMAVCSMASSCALRSRERRVRKAHFEHTMRPFASLS